LEKNTNIYRGWVCECEKVSAALEFDQFIRKFRDLIRPHSLIGYHCTKLTREEINSVKSDGLILQEFSTLTRRIDSLLSQKVIIEDVAKRLMGVNQADDENRANMLWFCSFEPHIAGQGGIERFFRSWGGEALYNFNENDPITGPVLRRIGIPCVVKVIVPMVALNNSYLPDLIMCGVFLKENGHELINSTTHEDFSTKDIPSENIIRVIEFPSEAFAKLTRCDEWDENLDG